jgi:sRNA-binding carbon storage regulator CsrA
MALVITRRLEEEFVIITPTGDEIVIKIGNNQNHLGVKLLISADPKIKIWRGEIYDDIKRKQQQQKIQQLQQGIL